jgi:Ca2+-binding RTX toxin-like protein
MATIIGTTGNDFQLLGLPDEDDEIYGDTDGTLAGVGGRDRIFGRGGADVISGDADVIGPNGRGGNDLIYGGDGDDNIFGDAFRQLYGIGGNDRLYQNAGSGFLVGDAFELAAGSRGGNDKLFGTGFLVGDATVGSGATCGDDVLDAKSATDGCDLRGDIFDEMLDCVGGADLLRGSAHDDLMYGDAYLLVGASTGGNDTLLGYAGDDNMAGDGIGLGDSSVGGDDILRGGAGDDSLIGDAFALGGSAKGGDDHLYGGAGNDILWGDGILEDDATGGNDCFYFGGSFGDDVVMDFRQGEDKLVFRGYDPADLQIEVVGPDTVLTTLGDDSVRLDGFTGTLVLGVDVIFA